MPQALVAASIAIDLEATYQNLKENAEVMGLNFSGGGRGKQDNDCGNLCFQLYSFPKAKFQISRNGKIQLTIPNSDVDYTLYDCLEKIEEYLVAVDKEKICELEPIRDFRDFIVDKT
jgi:hypothetical protein